MNVRVRLLGNAESVSRNLRDKSWRVQKRKMTVCQLALSCIDVDLFHKHTLQIYVCCLQAIVRLTEVASWSTGGYRTFMSVDSQGKRVAVRGIVNDVRKRALQVLDAETGSSIAETISDCLHPYCPVQFLAKDHRIVLELCIACEVVRSYKIRESEGVLKSSEVALTSCKPLKGCDGSGGEPLIVTVDGKVQQLKWSQGKLKLKVKTDRGPFEYLGRGDAGTQSTKRIHYVPADDLLVVSQTDHVSATRLSAGKEVWRFGGPTADRRELIRPWGLTSDDAGRLFVADESKGRVLVLSASSGKLLQVLLQEERLGRIQDVQWIESSRKLFVLHGQMRGAYVSIFSTKEASVV